MTVNITKSTQLIIEELERHCFEIERKRNVYHCTRAGCEEIKFVQSPTGEAHLFQVGKKPCHSVTKALKLAGACR